MHSLSMSRSFQFTTSRSVRCADSYEEDLSSLCAQDTRSPAVRTWISTAGARHLVVSLSGDAHGFVDEALAKVGRSHRIAVAVPNFMTVLAVIAKTDLLTAVPRQFLAMHATRFCVVSAEALLRLPDFRARIIAPKVAMMDGRLAWLFEAARETAR